MHAKPHVPETLEKDLCCTELHITHISGGTLKKVLGINDVTAPGSEVFLELRPHLVVTVRKAVDPEHGNDFITERIAEIPLDEVVEIVVDDEPEYGEGVVSVSRWIRDPSGGLRRFGT